MSLDKLNNLNGTWTGDNVLRLSWMNPPEFRSPSELTVGRAVGDKFLTFNYDWHHENIRHEGLLLVGYDAGKEVVNATWVDSWHSGAKPLALSGTVDERGTIDLRGAYEVPGHADWGWRIVIDAPEEDRLHIEMYNVSPEAAEDLAVRAVYKTTKNEITQIIRSASVPEGYFTVTPYLIIKDAVAALEFYKKAFGATELMCIKDADGRIRHAEIQIGDSPVMIVEEFPDYPEMPSPQSLGGSPAHIHLFVADIDRMFSEAVAAGAAVVMPVAEQTEDRRGGIKDPFGHIWWISTRIEDVSRAELQKRAAAL